MDESHSACTNIKLTTYSKQANESTWFKNKGNLKQNDRDNFLFIECKNKKILYEESKEFRSSFKTGYDFQSSSKDIESLVSANNEFKGVDSKMIQFKVVSNSYSKDVNTKNNLSSWIFGSGVSMNKINILNWHSSAINEVSRLSPIAEAKVEYSPQEYIKIITMRDVEKQPEL